ncbi:transposase family protein [Streptomyces sp. NPDC093510]|uniref:helix-turn-helix domain-containing protein n=1 Tax=Streptomyces sp. NPDC093510 TaxID=3155199 RepID=UPI00344452A7
MLAPRPRRRAVGAGAKHKLAFVDRLPAALVHLRHGLTQDVLACWFGVRPLSAARGRTVAPSPPAPGCVPSPRSSTNSTRAGRPGSLTAPRSGCAARPHEAGTVFGGVAGPYPRASPADAVYALLGERGIHAEQRGRDQSQHARGAS